MDLDEGKIIYIEKVKAINPKIIFKVLDDLYKEIKEKPNKRNYRKRFIISFLFWTGVREGELLLTKKKYIDFFNLTYYVPTLKRRQKNLLIPIPLNHIPKKELMFWMDYFEYFNIKKEDFIVRISDRAIRKLVKNVFNKYNIDAHPHMLRHSLAYFLVSNNIDIRYVREILRHVNIANTMIYTKPFMKEIRESLDKIRKLFEN